MFDPLTWEKIPGTNFEVMTNGSGELFVRLTHRTGLKELRLTPSNGGIHISDWNSPGKLILKQGIDVE